MITEFDDYMIHQAPVPVSQPGLSDRNFYDRYWFNGLDRDAKFFFEIGFGRYPNRFVQDGHFSVSIGEEQHSFHASCRAPASPMDATCGPMRIEVLKPMRGIRVVVEPNDTKIECDLTFHANSIPIQEPKNLMFDGVRKIMETQRFTQFGAWEGYFSINGERTEVKREQTPGNRDKSWGVRPVGEYEDGAPGKLTSDPGVYWVWSPLHFDGMGTMFLTREEPDGHPKTLGASFVKLYPTDAIPAADDPEAEKHLATARHKIQWRSGTRWPTGAQLELESRTGEVHKIELEPLRQFHLMGIGYQHAEWGHAVWHDELAIGSETWKLSEIDPDDYGTIHVHNIVRATMGDKVGVGTLETLCFGRHEPSGFQDLFDGAP